jgi:UDP:flavonoid glycosyltransferase YjiC (YdhE family)
MHQLILLLVLVVHAIIETTANELGKDYYIAFVSVPMLDHVDPLKAIAEELLTRGYRTSIAFPETEGEWLEEVKGLEYISTGPPPDVSNDWMVRNGHQWSGVEVYSGVQNVMQMFAEYQKAMYKKLLQQYTADPPDMLVIDRYSFAGYDVAHALNLSYVINNPTLLLDIDEPPAYIPAPYSGFALETQTIWERCLNPYYRLRFRLMMIEAFHTINTNRADNGLPAITSRWDLYGGRLVLTNTAFGVEYSRPLDPLFQMVGPQVSKKLQLPDAELLKWLVSEESAGAETVLVNLGQKAPLKAEQVQKLLEGLSQAQSANGEPVRILWVLPEEQHTLLPKERPLAERFRLVTTVPRLSVLQHPRVTIIVAAGGLTSVQDVLLQGKPMMLTPFSPGQLEVAKLATRLGVGLALDMHHPLFNAEAVTNTLQSVLENRTFYDAAAKMAIILEEAGAVTRAADLIEASHIVGTKTWLPNKHEQPWYQSQLLDVYGVCSLFIFAIALVLRGLWSACCSLFGSSAPPVKLKEE